MQTQLWQHIVEFCKKTIQQDSSYRGKHFQKLLALAEIKSRDRSANLGQYAQTVNKKNRGETAFQRALYKHAKLNLVGNGIQTELMCKDIELPVILSDNSRRPGVDLIGQTAKHGAFLWELKYKYEKSKSVPAGNAVDYAIFQALLYYAIVNRDHPLLHKNKVCRSPESPRFLWEDVSKSHVILVLANDYYWTGARTKYNEDRIEALANKIREHLEIDVLLCSIANYPFYKREWVRDGRYEPKLEPCVDAIPATAKLFPSYRLIATFD